MDISYPSTDLVAHLALEKFILLIIFNQVSPKD